MKYLKILYLNLKLPGILLAIHSPSTKCTLEPLASHHLGHLNISEAHFRALPRFTESEFLKKTKEYNFFYQPR